MSLKKAWATWKVPARSGPYKTLSQLKQFKKKKQNIDVHSSLYGQQLGQSKCAIKRRISCGLDA